VRNAFIALLVVNLVYFAWAQWVDEPRTPPVNEALAKLPRLKLISELPADQRPAAPPAAQQPAAVAPRYPLPASSQAPTGRSPVSATHIASTRPATAGTPR
jgi:hypothetical protein